MIDKTTIELVNAWLAKACSDIASADKLMRPLEPLLENAVYHCQRAAEKSIKAILALHAQPIPYIHDIAKLLQLALPLEPALAKFEEQADSVTPNATA